MKTIKTQSELDALPLDYEGEIYITGNIETFNHKFTYAVVYVKDNAVIENHNGGWINWVFDNAVIEKHNGGYIHWVSDNAVIQNHNGGYITRVSGKSVIQNHNGGWIDWVCENAVIENHNGGYITRVSGKSVIENNNGGGIIDVYGSAVIENHNGGTVYDVRDNAVINTTGGIIYHKANRKNIKINNNGGTVIAIPPCNNTFEWFKNSFPIETKGEYATLYKAVRKRDGKYYSHHDENFEYIIGEEKTNEVDTDVNNVCSFGIHLSHKHWTIMFGFECELSDLAILELNVLIKDIIVPTDCDGTVRTSKAFVVREVPQSEW